MRDDLLLVDPVALRGLLGSVSVLDVRWQLGRSDGHEDYLAGHIPGAAYADLETDLSDPPFTGTGGRHPLPDPGRFGEAMRRCGVSAGRPVVVYDAVAGTSAARAWWLLRYFGHPDARLLDGGWPAWLDTASPSATGAEQIPRGDFEPVPGHLPLLDAADAEAVARQGVLVDARAAERFRGEVEPVDPAAGHIPGAVNVPTSANLAGGRFRNADELAEAYRVPASGQVAAYCGSGVTAAHDVFAMALLGIDAGLYAGSWSDWLTDPRRPVATGD